MLVRRVEGGSDLLAQPHGSATLETGRSAGSVAATSRRAPRVLMLCTLFTLPYRVLRTVQGAGTAVFVMGNVGSRGFRFSRYCAGYTHSERAFDGSFDAAMADEVNACIERLDIDVVIAGDQPSARSLIGIRPMLKARCFPMPDLATFDLLNDKWAFFQLCSRIGVRCPPTTLFDDRDALWRDVTAGDIALPLIAKPLSLDGSRGVVPLKGATARRDLETIRYAPVLVQEFIEGVDIGASAYCEHGKVRAFILHRLARATYTAFPNQDVLAAVTAIAHETSYTGVFNFDMRMAEDGTVYFLECNPRFFYKMSLSMMAGVNFAEYGLSQDVPPRFVDNSAVRMTKAFLATLPTPWRLTRRDWGMMWHVYSDPLPFAREMLHIDWEDRSY